MALTAFGKIVTIPIGVTVGTTTLSEAELSTLDAVTPGTGAASKALVLNVGEDATWPATGILTYGGTGITSSGAELNLVDGSVIGNTVASKAAMVDASKNLRSDGTGVGTAGTGATVIHYGDGVNMTAVVTVTAAVMNPVGVSANLGVGYLAYTLPAGACIINSAYMSMALSGVTVTNDTPDAGLGTVIASGAVTALGGTATFEDIINGSAMADTNGTALVAAGGPTAGVPLVIATAAAHTVHFNMADGWGANTDASGLLDGTIVINFTRQAA